MGAEVGPYVISAVQVDLGILFLVAGLSKLRAPREFIQAVAEYRILPRMAPVVGAAVIGSELFVCAALVFGQLLAVASLVALGWLVVFAVVTGVNLRRGRLIPCHCFGGGGELIGGRTLGRIALIGAGVVLVAVARLMANVPPPAVMGPAEFIATAALTVFVALAGAWLLRAGELRAVARTGKAR
jgi:hypothetical protein